MEHTNTHNINNEESRTCSSCSWSSWILPGSILLTGVLIAGSILYSFSSHSGSSVESLGKPSDNNAPSAQNPSPSPTPAGQATAPKITNQDVILGDPKAPVTMFVYADYQCPFCTRLHQGAEASVRQAYVLTGKVKEVFRNFQFLGPESTAAANAAECAKDQGKFWAYHDALYDNKAQDEKKGGGENDGSLNKTLFLQIAKNLGMNTDQFGKCIDSSKYSSKIQSDYTDGQTYGVQSTPTVFINNVKILGAQPFEATGAAGETALKPIIEAALKGQK